MNLPQAFLQQMRRCLPAEEYESFLTALDTTALPVSLRINERKAIAMALSHRSVAWCEKGVYLEERPAFTFDPLFHAGCYYVQEASSMFVAEAVKTYIHGDVCMLDLCAAPGGKSTLLRQLLSDDSLLVANEYVRGRAQILSENLLKWGHPHTICTANAPADFSALTEVFDAVLADVPCSGEGMFRKDANAIDEWSEQNVDLCVKRQRSIVEDIWGALKAGGILLYSTCTYNLRENEENVRWICDTLGGELLPLAIKEEWGITGDLSGAGLPVYRFLPHKTEGEGFFMAIIRKTGDVANTSDIRKPKSKKQKETRPQPIPTEIKAWIKDAARYVFQETDETISAFPSRYEPLLSSLRQYLYILHAGIPLAQRKGKDFIPHHGLAISAALDKCSFPLVSLDYEQALAYLRKESFTLPADTPRGYVAVTYDGHILGFMKNIGNRANNLYPAEWKIRSPHSPNEIVKVVY